MSGNLVRTTYLALDAVRDLAHAQRLYAILDACDQPAVVVKVAELGEARAVSLYRGMAEEEFSAFAPYLVQTDTALLDWIVTTLWQEAWGVFVVFDGALPTLRSHFRRFLLVDDPQGEKMYFRFYDPRVLRKYLPTCTPQELRQFYDGIETFLTNDPEDRTRMQSLSRAATAGSVEPPPVSAVTRIGQRFPIREPQMTAFAPEAEAAFESRLIRHLREHHMAQVCDIPDAVLHTMVRAGIARARRYGMTWESNLIAYVALMFEIAPNFDQHPRMQMILASHSIHPENKIDLLIERTPENVWKDMKRRCDLSQWFPSGKGAA